MSIPHIPLDKNSDIPLYRQLSDALQALMQKGELKPDTRLPSIRQLSQALDVNNTTVVNAYKQLERVAAVYTVVGRGTFVAVPTIPEPTVDNTPVEIPELPEFTPDYINFADMSTDASLFPTTGFRRAFDAVLDRDGGAAFDNLDNQGYKPLRESFGQMMGAIDPDNIHVTTDIQQGLEAVAAVLLAPGDTVFVERPTSQMAVAVFLSQGANIVEMPMLSNGPDFDALDALLKQHKPKLIYTMPNFQIPTGICYSSESMRRLIELADACGAFIIEEDQYSDFYYDGVKRNLLRTESDRVIYIKSFAKTLISGLRLGYLVCPGDIPVSVKGDGATCGYIQRGLDLFLRSGAYELHLANMRSVYGRKYQKVVAALNTYLGHLADFVLPAGGFGIWVTPHEVGDHAERILQRKVVVSPGWLYGTDIAGFRINFTAVTEEQVAEGLGVIAQVLGGE